jgi:hypothetical protein
LIWIYIFCIPVLQNLFEVVVYGKDSDFNFFVMECWLLQYYFWTVNVCINIIGRMMASHKKISIWIPRTFKSYFILCSERNFAGGIKDLRWKDYSVDQYNHKVFISWSLGVQGQKSKGKQEQRSDWCKGTPWAKEVGGLQNLEEASQWPLERKIRMNVALSATPLF